MEIKNKSHLHGIKKICFVIFILILAVGCTPKEVKNVEELINNIGNVTIDSELKIKVAQEGYDKLSLEDKEKVTNYKLLEESTKTYENIINVYLLINNIGQITKESESKIKEAEDMYNKLTNSEKIKITNYSILLDARDKFNNLPKEINLTKENIKDYFSINTFLNTTESHISGKHTTYATISTSAKAVQSYSKINNIVITVKVNYQETRQEYGTFYDSKTITLTINPQTGIDSKSFSVSSSVVDLIGSSVTHKAPKYSINSYDITKVSGSIEQ